VPVDAKETGNDPEPRPRRVGVLAVARTIFFGLLMIGALVGGIVLVGLLVLIVRIAIGLAAG
jgi:hypothetical protein